MPYICSALNLQETLAHSHASLPSFGMVETRRLSGWDQEDTGGKNRPRVPCVQWGLCAKATGEFSRLKNSSGHLSWSHPVQELRTKTPPIDEENAFAYGVSSVLYIT